MAEHLRQPKSLISTLFTVLILVGAAIVLSPFLLAILWAGIIATAFWPLHCRIRGRFPGKPNGAAFLTTLVVAFLLVGPMIGLRSEEHTSELQSLMRISYAVFCLKTKSI